MASSAASAVGPSVALITTNVGSLFEDAGDILTNWITCMAETINELKPDFVAIHMQEVGGKHYKDNIGQISGVLDQLAARAELQEYGRAAFLCDKRTGSSQFTALGSLFFVHDAAREVSWWDFEREVYVPFDKAAVSGGNDDGETFTSSQSSIEVSEAVCRAHWRHQKFPAHFFPQYSWSRKGYLLTRWRFGGDGPTIDLTNVHLFHDEDNLIAMQASPSLYTVNRKRALNHVLRAVGLAAAAADEEDDTGADDVVGGGGGGGGGVGGDGAATATATATASTTTTTGTVTTAAPAPLLNEAVVSAPADNCFLFGDFNFRLNLKKLLSQPDGSISSRRDRAGNSTLNIYQGCVRGCGRGRGAGPSEGVPSEAGADETGDADADACADDERDRCKACGVGRIQRVRVEAKKFLPSRPEEFLAGGADNVFLQYDGEFAKSFARQLRELPIAFPPTYPYSEGKPGDQIFIGKRCPGWCDRIIMNPAALAVISGGQPQCGAAAAPSPPPVYRLIAEGLCVGDHKPVLLSATLARK